MHLRDLNKNQSNQWRFSTERYTQEQAFKRYGKRYFRNIDSICDSIIPIICMKTRIYIAVLFKINSFTSSFRGFCIDVISVDTQFKLKVHKMFFCPDMSWNLSSIPKSPHFPEHLSMNRFVVTSSIHNCLSGLENNLMHNHNF